MKGTGAVMHSWSITYWRHAGQLLANFFPVPNNSRISLGKSYHSLVFFSFQKRWINSTEGVKCNHSMRTTSQALMIEPKLGRQSHKVPREVLRSPVAWDSCGSFGVWGLHSRFKYDQFWNLHWNISWWPGPALLWVFLYSRNRLLDICGLCTTTNITWCNLRQFFCCKRYNCLLLFCRVWHIFTKKAWCTGTSRYYTKENKVYPLSWLKGCGTLFFPFLVWNLLQTGISNS